MTGEHYAPLVRWSCSQCGKGGEVSIPPSKYGPDAYELAASAHRIANVECADEWGASSVRVEQGEYPS